MPGKSKQYLNILKVRDDERPIRFRFDSNGSIEVEGGGQPAWCAGPQDGRTPLRSRIEPWLTALFQADHLNLLIGTGLTYAVKHIAGVNDKNSMASSPFSAFSKEISEAAQESAQRAGRGSTNLEDQIRTATQLIRGLEILMDLRVDKLKAELDQVMASFANSILEGEKALIAATSTGREEAFRVLASFLMSFAGRTGVRDRLGVFTTNYDRVVEAGAEIAGLHLIDRFVGTISPIFRSSRLDLDLHYNPPGIRGEPRYAEGVARFTKLHGSLDWALSGSEIRRFGLPFGAPSLDPYLHAPGIAQGASDLLIYPNSSKDRETAEYPYVELFRDFAAAVVRPNTVTVTYGCSFGDEHINRV